MSTRKLFYDELNDFNKNIVDELEALTKSREEALRIFNLYFPVLRLLEDGDLEDEDFYADQFFEAHLLEYTPDKWIAKIHELRGTSVQAALETIQKAVNETSSTGELTKNYNDPVNETRNALALWKVSPTDSAAFLQRIGRAGRTTVDMRFDRMHYLQKFLSEQIKSSLYPHINPTLTGGPSQTEPSKREVPDNPYIDQMWQEFNNALKAT